MNLQKINQSEKIYRNIFANDFIEFIYYFREALLILVNLSSKLVKDNLSELLLARELNFNLL